MFVIICMAKFDVTWVKPAVLCLQVLCLVFGDTVTSTSEMV